ncbi:AraC family transcriptional regulator ligand-binding domain-containing protein [Nocardia huaxiensis]|uniref:AraC family transcriptional regulator ligand-binding domain-containing protein n=1 Tax=Nocardia huaxiensis TaxID=2755382 RepID=A0A7D6VDB8_9NOCA|nr:AraC family transcriptional regulator [Nocardia huaxiensis]QLY32634.1 AraC family transcriptional regulator ligand-binding domain-containing protein [Nocardia huaxiensis]
MIEGTLPARTIALIRTTALRVGVTPAHLAAVAGLDPADLDDDLLRVPTESAWRIWELIDAAAGPGSGLAATAGAEFGGLSAWDYLFSSGATLADSLRTIVELRAIVTDPAVSWEVIEDGGLLIMRERTAIEPEPVLAPVEEFVLSLVLRRIREATRQLVVPIRVGFSHHATERYRWLVDEFGTSRIEFGVPHAQLTFLDVGTLPTGADPHLGRVMRQYVELTLASSRAIPDWHEKLRHAISAALRRGDLDLDGVARRLAVSPRTLQRRLHEMNSSWRKEVETVRYEQSLDLLRGTTLPIQSVAARLGYTDARALRRAFHRWTGQTPDAFRRELASAAGGLLTEGMIPNSSTRLGGDQVGSRSVT